VEAGRRAGPYESLPCPYLQCSPVGTVPKKHTDDLRPIHHLSYPRDESHTSINSQIEYSDCSLLRFSEAVMAITKMGKGCYLAKYDIRDAFKLIRVRPDQQSVLGVFFMGRYYVELVLPFGLKSAPAIFEMFATAIEKFILANGAESLKHYLDDFLLISRNKEVAMNEDKIVLDTFQELGVPLSIKKLASPCQRIEFLGIEIDTIAMTIELPKDKLERYRSILLSLQGKKKATIEELQKIIGVLVYSCMVIQHGNSFYYHLMQMLKKAKAINKLGGIAFDQPEALTPGAFRELEWWSKFIVDWNGKNMIAPLDGYVTPNIHSLYTDACKDGMGAWFDGCEYVSHAWNRTELYRSERSLAGITTTSMPYLELLALTLGVGVWAEKLRGKAIIVWTDCEPVRLICNSGYSSNGFIMMLMRQLAYFKALYNIFIKVEWIQGSKNVVADCLSRLPKEQKLTDDNNINFDSFLKLKEVQDAVRAKRILKRERVKPFPLMNWNKLPSRSKREPLPSQPGNPTMAL